MGATTTVMHDAGRRLHLAQLLSQTQGIATLPQVTSRIISTLEDPRSSPQALHDIVLRDPALTARMLKVVNSTFYGMPGRIGSVQRAIGVLGMTGVKNLAIAASLGALFGGAAICEGFVARDLWVHSIAVAVTTRELARATKLAAPDEAFLAALIHDIGLLAALQAGPSELQAVCDLARAGAGLDFCAAERQILGFDHQALGMGLAARWRLPRQCQLTAGHHHQPDDVAADGNRPLLRLVHVADTLCCQAGYGFNLTALRQPLDVVASGPIGLDPVAIRETRQRLDGLVAEAVALLG